jgi:hypothetical protein
MKSLTTLTLASLFLAAPSLALAQKAGKPTPPLAPLHTVVHHDVVHHNTVTPKTDKDADNDAAEKAAKTGNKTALNTLKADEKTEHRDLKAAHDEKHLLRGIHLTASETAQINTIEKNYDAQLRALTKTEKTDDRTARKTHTADTDVSFDSQLASLNTQERADLRATLTPSQQAMFDANVASLLKPKH